MKMKYCPQCEVEYQDWVAECADCHKPLVSELPKKEPEQVDPETALVCVKIFLNEQEAEIARGLLESNGISVMLAPAADPSRKGFMFSRGNQIWVRKEDAEAATELLNNPGA